MHSQLREREKKIIGNLIIMTLQPENKQLSSNEIIIKILQNQEDEIQKLKEQVKVLSEELELLALSKREKEADKDDIIQAESLSAIHTRGG